MLTIGLISLIVTSSVQYLVILLLVARGKATVSHWGAGDVLGFGIYYGAIIWIAAAALQEVNPS